MKNFLLTFALMILLAMTQVSSAEKKDSEQSSVSGEKAHTHHGKKMHKRHAKMLKRADINDDGKIDLNEYLTNAEERFKKLDLDSDGYVTPEEHREAGKAMREKHRELRKQRRAEREAKRSEQQSADVDDE